VLSFAHLLLRSLILKIEMEKSEKLVQKINLFNTSILFRKLEI